MSLRRQRLDIVVPVYNEQETLAELFAQLTRHCQALDGVDWRVILVDDGSRDASVDMILDQARRDPHFSLVALSRNFGHQAAISAGLDHTDADAVVVMDADLQDPPDLLGPMLDRFREGFDVVYAVRRSRKESRFKQACYRSFYRIMQRLSKTPIPLDSGDFCLMSRRVVEHLGMLPERNRFVRGLRAWLGFRQTGIEYDRPARFAGSTKYSYRRLARLALSGFLGFSNLPLRAAIWLGFLSGGIAVALILWVLITRAMGIVGPTGWTSTIAVILFMGGVQLMILGVIGEYLGSVNDEVRRRPLYLVDRCLNAGPRKSLAAAEHADTDPAPAAPGVEVTIMPIARARSSQTPTAAP